MDKYVYVVLSKVYIKNTDDIRITCSADYSDFIIFDTEEKAFAHIEQEIENWTHYSKIPFKKLFPLDIVGDDTKMWIEWVQEDFNENNLKNSYILFKQKVL